MNYSMIYVKRTFLKNRKKQLFLIFGIAAFIVLLSMYIMRVDSNTHDRKEYLDSFDWRFSHKTQDVSMEMIEYLKGYEEIENVEAITKLEVENGIENVEWIVSANVPKTWKLKLLYGEFPQKGEILLTETALLGGRQPIPGEKVMLGLKVGTEIKQVEAVISGVVEAFTDFVDSYAFLQEEDFKKISGLLSEEEQQYDAFYIYKEKSNVDAEKLEEFFNKMSHYKHVRWGDAEEERTYHWGEMREGVLFAVIFGGPCIGAIIYMVLQDEKKSIGIMRALGAKKSQIASMVIARIIVSGIIGILIGGLFSFGVVFLQKKLMYSEMVVGGNTGWESIGLIPFVGLILLLALQIPGVHMLLRETPVNLMGKVCHKGENLIRSKEKVKTKIKHPIWWYAGLEGKRLRGQRIGLMLITTLGMLLPTTAVIALRSDLKATGQEAVTETYTIGKENGYFGKEEIEAILDISGVVSAGFPEKQTGMEIVRYDGKKVDVQLQILDEVSFKKMKEAYEARGEVWREESGEELLNDGGILVCQTMDTIRERVKKGDAMEVYSPTGECHVCEIVMVGRSSGEIGFDYYLFLGFERYCEIFGFPQMQEMLVSLNGIKMKNVEKELRKIGADIYIQKNEILYGNTEEELNRDAWISNIVTMLFGILSTIAFFFCYYSFYYLAKTEEYEKLYAMGASKGMIRKIMISQSLRNSLLLTLFSVVAGYLLYISDRKMTMGQWLNIANLPVVELMVIAFFVVGISMSATWFAAKQVIKELEQAA